MLQRLPFQILHRDERVPVVFIDLVNRADVWMIQRRGGLRLSLKPAQGLRIFGYIVRKELQCHEAFQLRILGLVDNTHPSSAELLQYPVVGNRLADHAEGVTQRSYLMGALRFAQVGFKALQDWLGFQTLPGRTGRQLSPHGNTPCLLRSATYSLRCIRHSSSPYLQYVVRVAFKVAAIPPLASAVVLPLLSSE